MSDLEFDRDAVGVKAKKDWTDSRTFVEIAAGFDNTGADGVAFPVPASDGTGTSALIAALKYYTQTMKTVSLEFSDACAVLGSGQETAISNTDAVETEIMNRFALVAARLGGR